MKTKTYSEIGFLWLRDIIGDKGHPGIIPVSCSSWYKGIAEGINPKPVKMSERTSTNTPLEPFQGLDGQGHGAPGHAGEGRVEVRYLDTFFFIVCVVFGGNGDGVQWVRPRCRRRGILREISQQRSFAGRHSEISENLVLILTSWAIFTGREFKIFKCGLEFRPCTGNIHPGKAIPLFTK